MRALAIVFASLILPLANGFPAFGNGKLRETAFRENFYGVDINGDQAWIVGYYGAILHTRNRGETWQVQRSPVNNALFTVRFVDRDKGWITGSYGAILSTVDGGKNWRAQNSGTAEHLLGLTLLDQSHGWAVGSRGMTLRTDNGGQSWSLSPVPGDFTFSGVSFIDRSRGWIAGEFGVIFHTADGGKTWSKQKSPVEVSFASGESRNLFALRFDRADSGYAVGLDGVVLRAGPGGSWKIVRQGASANGSNGAHHLFAVARVGERLWAAGERGTLLHSDRDGKDWQQVKAGVPRVSLNAIAFGSNGFGLAVGNRGVVLRTDDAGAAWKQLKPGSALQPFELVRLP